MANIGFIGLGHMGLPMAINLLKAKHNVTGYDKLPTACENFIQEGGKISSSIKNLAAGQDVIITMLPAGPHLKDVCLGENGLYRVGTSCLHIDCSTIDVETSRELHQAALNAHLVAVDAPVSGGVAGAKAGNLTFMVGGSLNAFEQAHPILMAMGKKIFHAGDAGSGQTAKICNNMILGISMIAISEAFVLAKQLGLSEKKLFEIVNNASGQCWAMSHYPPVKGLLPNVPANHGYQPGFSSAMMLKDLLLSQQAAEQCGTLTPLGAHAAEIYQEFIEKGKGELDFSAIICGT